MMKKREKSRLTPRLMSGSILESNVFNKLKNPRRKRVNIMYFK